MRVHASSGQATGSTAAANSGASVRLESPRSMLVVNRVDSAPRAGAWVCTNQRPMGLCARMSMRLNRNWLSPANGSP